MNINNIKIGSYYVCKLLAREHTLSNGKIMYVLSNGKHNNNILNNNYDWNLKNFFVKIINILGNSRVLVRVHNKDNKEIINVHYRSVVKPATIKDVICK